MSSEPYAIPPKDRAFEGIRWYIKHYDLQGGDRLPAERVLCEVLGVSRTALRAAITRLISCGTLESRRGSGTYVCPPKPLNIFQETWNYTQAVERVGSKSTARLIWSKVAYADIDLAQKAQIDLGMPALLHSARARGQWFSGVNRDGLRQSVFMPLASRSRF